jgi:hypothetical protein
VENEEEKALRKQRWKEAQLLDNSDKKIKLQKEKK